MKSEFKEDPASSKSSDGSGDEKPKAKAGKPASKQDPILEKYKRPTAAADAEKAAEDALRAKRLEK